MDRLISTSYNVQRLANVAAQIDWSRLHDGSGSSGSSLVRVTGIASTPAFVINGYFVSGDQPYATFERMIQRALQGG